MDDLSECLPGCGSERAAARAIITAQDWSTWDFLNGNVDEWVNTYYTSPGPRRRGQRAKPVRHGQEQVAEAFLALDTGGRDLAPGADGAYRCSLESWNRCLGRGAKRITVGDDQIFVVEATGR